MAPQRILIAAGGSAVWPSAAPEGIAIAVLGWLDRGGVDQ
jgi:hypothetical protein